MIYFTGFQNWEKQFGELVSIANSEPEGFKGNVDRLHFFAPNWKDVNLWKTSFKADADWEHFVAMYRIVCRERWQLIAHWLKNLNPEYTIKQLKRGVIEYSITPLFKIIQTKSIQLQHNLHQLW